MHFSSTWRFQSAIDKKEECREPEERYSKSNHLEFILPERSDLLGGEECQPNTENGGEEPARTGKYELNLAATTFYDRTPERKLEQSRKHIQKWHQLQHH